MKLLRVMNPTVREQIYAHVHDLGMDIACVKTKDLSEVDYDDPAIAHFQFFEVEDRDVDMVVDNLTKIFPGREIRCYVLESEAIRPAGELVRKKVTKEGILPF